MKKNVEKTSLEYLKRLKNIGIFGIVFAMFLVVFDVYSFEKNWYSIFSIIVDVLLIIFSIYFIIKSRRLTKIESRNKK